VSAWEPAPARLPPALAGTQLRILATSDLGATTVPLSTSYGTGGTCAGVETLLEHECERQATIWLDAGDFVVGSPAHALLGERPWAEVATLPISAATVGNHEFDDGVDALREALPRLAFPVVCANLDIGLDPATLVQTPGGAVGVVGLTHPRIDELSKAPPTFRRHDRIVDLARRLRRDGARWVVALLHDGVEWWPTDDPACPAVATRATRLEPTVRPWARAVDLILGGHNFAAWTGTLAGVPAAQPHLFAASVAVVDLAPDPVVRGIFVVPPTRPAASTPATDAIDAAAARTVAQLTDRWTTRTGAARYLPDLLAEALRVAAGTDAGFALPSLHAIQAPLDGAIAAVGPGPVSELDLVRLLGAPGYDPVIAELRPGELERAIRMHWTFADPRHTMADVLPWNWCRMPAGVSVDGRVPATVAVLPGVVAHLSEWLGRDVEAQAAGADAIRALRLLLESGLRPRRRAAR
jgi:hypothetical protein